MNSFVVFACLVGVSSAGFLGGLENLGAVQQGYAGAGIGSAEQGYAGQIGGIGGIGGQQLIQGGQFAGAALNGQQAAIGGQQLIQGGQFAGAALNGQQAAIGGQQAEAHVQFVAHHGPQEAYHDHYHHAPAHYAFEYSVNDPLTGDIKSQHETREGDVVKGFYALKEADGTIREVHYTADDQNGFNAEVRRIGNAAHQASRNGYHY